MILDYNTGMKDKEKVGFKSLVFDRVYSRLTDYVDARVSRGDLSLLPSEVKLSNHYDCSRVTVRRVLETLESEGKIRKHPGKGTVPISPEERQNAACSKKIAVYVQTEMLPSVFSGQYSKEVLGAIHEFADEPNQNVELCSQLTDPVSFDPENFAKWIERHNVKAFVVRPMDDEMEKLAFCARTCQCSIVIWGRQSWSESLHSVSVDYYNDMRRSIELLQRFGHKRIAFVGVEGYDEPTRARWQAYRDVLSKVEGISVSSPCVGLQYGEIYSFTQKLINQDKSERPTAIVTGGEYMDWPCLQAIAESGLKIPEDITVLATDDFVQAEHYRPAISVIRQPVGEMISRAIQLARETTENRSLPNQRIMLDSEIVIRKSISCAK